MESATPIVIVFIGFIVLALHARRLERKNDKLQLKNNDLLESLEEKNHFINRLREYLSDEVVLNREQFHTIKDLQSNNKQLISDTTEYLRDAYEGTKEAFYDAETFKKQAEDKQAIADLFKEENDELRKQLRIVTAKLEMYKMPAGSFQKITIATRG